MTDSHTFETPHDGEVLGGIWAKGHDWMDSSIKLLTHGRGTHFAFIRGRNGRIVENFWPCVRERQWNIGERDTVEEYRIAGSTPEDWAKLETWFDKQLAKPIPPTWLCWAMQIPFLRDLLKHRAAKYRTVYSISDLLRYAVGWPPVRSNEGFCSMWGLKAMRDCLSPCKQILVRLPFPDWGSPRDMRISPLFIKRKKLHQRITLLQLSR